MAEGNDCQGDESVHDPAAIGTLTSMSPGRKGSMSAEHKAALAAGRSQGTSVRRYLEALASTKPKRGRRASPESLQRQLDEVRKKLASADPLAALLLMQQERDLEIKLSGVGEHVDLATLEAAFIDVAASYGESKGIHYDVWRKAGVPAETLKKAGIGR
jgi:hypothetical protein